MGVKDFRLERIGGYLHKVIELKDESGKIIHRIVKPVMIELKLRDILQIIVGATMLAIPVGLTEECWRLGETLPLFNSILLVIITISFISLFVYFNFYRHMLKSHKYEYIKRVLAIYILSTLIVTMFLTLIEKCPWTTDPLIAIRRIIIATLPCSMSATVSDVIK